MVRQSYRDVLAARGRAIAQEVEEIEPGIYAVPSASEPGGFYEVIYRMSQVSCTCPHFLRSNAHLQGGIFHCKHCYAVLEHLGGETI